MELFSTLLGALTSLFLAVSITLHVWVGGIFSEKQVITILPPASVERFATPSSQTIVASTKTSSATTKKDLITEPAANTVAAKPLVPEVSTITPPLSLAISAEELNTQTRGALVNILCKTGGGSVHPISGSGVFVDSRGIILTNAHIGQYFLLKDYPTKGNVDCVIRIGSPAAPTYRATLLFLPPMWLNQNASQLIAEKAKGTGEDDYAFLLVTGTTGPGTLPVQFPSLPMTTEEPHTNDAAFLAAYPAGFLDGTSIEKNLFPSSAYATVKELFTFGDGNAVDLVSIGGTIVSQGGSSGGATVRASDGKLFGLISTATSADTTAQRDLRSITLAHIDRSLKAAGKNGIASLLSQNVTEAAANFAATIAPSEKEQLIKAIEQK